MIYARWFFLSLLDLLMLLTVPFAAVIVSAFTRAMPHGLEPYTWGWLWGTHDNPPQGDEGYVRKRSLFPGVTDGWRGYINRALWMIRNPLYGLAKRCEIVKEPDMVLTYTGNPDISDKDRIPGWYFAQLHQDGKLVGFELYAVLPYTKSRCLRTRLGWKIMSRRFRDEHYAQLVNTFNPFDGYGDNT